MWSILVTLYDIADVRPVFEDKKYSEEANRAAEKAAGNIELDVRGNKSDKLVEQREVGPRAA